MAYVALTFDDGSDPDALYAQMLAQLQAAFPGWQPYPGHLETALMAAQAGENADQRALIADVGAAVFAQWGRTTLGVAQVAAVAATIPVTFTAVSTGADRVIPSGTPVIWADASTDDDLTFVTTADLTLLAGHTTVTATLTASMAGSAPNQVPAGTLLLGSGLSWITVVTATAAASGGVDAETDEAYVARLSLEAQTLYQGASLPGDFAILALTVGGVARALAVDGWNGSTGHSLDRTVAVVPLQADGTPCSSTIRTAVATLLQSKREVGFLVAAALPTYHAVAISVTVAAVTGADHTQVANNVTAALTTFLDPAAWSGSTVRYLDVARVIGDADGVDHISALTINGSAADLALSGDVPLPAGMATSAVADSWLTSVSSVVVVVT